MQRIPLVQRIIGVVVLLSLAVIFLPFLSSKHEKESPDNNGSNIPPMPENVSTIVYRLSEGGVFLSDAPQIAPAPPAQPVNGGEASVPEQSAEKGQERVPPVAKFDGASSAWIVQLGTFSQEQNALTLRNKLRAQGYPTFIEKFKSESGDLWRLSIGPELSVKRAEKLKADVEKMSGLQGMLVRHE